MKLRQLSMVSILACLTIGSVGKAADDSDDHALTGRLTGFQQVPSILTTGTGTFHATLGASSLTFTLSYSNLSGSATGAHIHFAQRGVNGAIFVFFCGGPKPACPAGTSGTLMGTITAADVAAVPAQGITAGSFADLVRILRSGDAYVNVHTANFPGGEIRAQVSRAED